MAITVRKADAFRAGSCNACDRLAGDAGGTPVLVVLFARACGGTEVRLCPACLRELAQALR